MKALWDSQMQSGSDLQLLVQLPFFDHDVVKKLSRKKVGSVAELASLDAEERLELLIMSGALVLVLFMTVSPI
jgi:hypothetical protein